MQNEIDKRFIGPKLFDRRTFKDSRGSFSEFFRAQWLIDAGIHTTFVQDNYSHSYENVVRGLHYQLRHPQAKLLCVLRGKILDVGLDLRKSSKTYGQWFSVELSEDNGQMLYLPEGFAHGFSVISGPADLFYKCSDIYVADDQYGVAWNDSALEIDWRVSEPIVSDRDTELPLLSEIPESNQPT